MKFDITRAWKDETYREGLSDEQFDALPSNPAGELSDAELESAFGGWGNGFGNGCGFGSGCGYTNIREHTASFGLICEVNIFSVSALISNIAVLGSVTQICAKG